MVIGRGLPPTRSISTTAVETLWPHCHVCLALSRACSPLLPLYEGLPVLVLDGVKQLQQDR